MAGGTGRPVLVMVTGLGSYQTALLRGIHPVLADRGLSVLACVNNPPGPEFPPDLACRLAHNPPTAVITTGAQRAGHRQVLDRLTGEHGIPTVYVGHEIPGSDCVRADNVQAMTALLGHLLDGRGARTPVLVRGLAHQSDHAVREAAYRRELTRRGIPVDQELIVDGAADLDITNREIRALLRRRRDMDAVITMDDWAALTVLAALTDEGMRVPDDVAVTGFDNYPVAALNWPGITTVDQNLVEQGAAAARLVLRRLAGDRGSEQVLMPCRLVVRGSSARTEAELTEPQTVESVSRSAKEHLGSQDALLRMGRALMRCQQLEELRDALAESMIALGIARSFLVTYEDDDPAPGPDGIPHRACRLVLDVRDGRQHPVTDHLFSSCDLLPGYLRAELSRGCLGVHPLATARGQLGYLLYEPPFGPVSVAEAIGIDVTRTLEAVLSRRALAAHSAMLEHLVAVRTSELEELNRELQRSLTIDGLTRIANRTALSRHLDEQWPAHVAEREELAAVMVDVDLFKAYNDRYGHVTGDKALQIVAACLARAVRYPDDLACRFGGEEFLAVLPRSGIAAALTVARRFRELLAEAAVPHDASTVAPVVTASVGIAALVATPGGSPEQVIAAADQALYRAKHAGRDRIMVHEAPAPLPVLHSATER